MVASIIITYVYSSRNLCLYHACNSSSPFTPERMQRPEKVYTMSWGKGEARGAPPLMSNTLIHTWGTATFEPPKWLFPTMFTPTMTQPNPSGDAGVPQAPPKAARMQWTTIARWG